jgi:hypothetical protein
MNIWLIPGIRRCYSIRTQLIRLTSVFLVLGRIG